MGLWVSILISGMVSPDSRGSRVVVCGTGVLWLPTKLTMKICYESKCSGYFTLCHLWVLLENVCYLILEACWPFIVKLKAFMCPFHVELVFHFFPNLADEKQTWLKWFHFIWNLTDITYEYPFRKTIQSGPNKMAIIVLATFETHIIVAKFWNYNSKTT